MIGRVFSLLKMTFEEIVEHAVLRQAGALAFFGLFALPPLLLLVLLGGRVVFGDDSARDALLEQVEAQMGEEARKTVDSVIENTPRPGRGDLTAQIVGIVALLFGATAAFKHLQSILNAIWKARQRRGWWRFLGMLIKRGATFLAILGTSLLLLAYLSAGTLITTFREELSLELMPELVPVLTGGLETLASFLLLALHFTLVFKYLPDAKVPIRAAVYGASLTAGLFLLSQYGLEIYLGYVNLGSAFGAASSLVITLVWFYVAAVVVLAGAVFSHAFARWRGDLPA